MTSKLSVFISGSGTTLENILNVIEQGKLDAEVVSVVSSRNNVRGNDVARDNDIPLSVIVAKDYKGNVKGFSQAICQAIEPTKPDLIILGGFLNLFIIPKEYDSKVLNIHPSLIPDFCGKGFYGDKVHQAVLEAGVKETGCTVHFANNEYDEGPIVLQQRVPVLADDDVASLSKRVRLAEFEAYPEAIRQVISQ